MTNLSAFYRNCRLSLLLISCLLVLNGCYTYRVETQAQAGTEMQSKTVHSFFWGYVQSPKKITTPLCDTLKVNGMAVVTAKSNFGFSLITVLTLGIWSPMTIEWKCGKPCQVEGHL